LDIEISVIPAKGDKSIEIVQRKSKDAEMAAPVYVDLEPVAIPGWFDEDGEAVTSAVVVKGEVPESKQKNDSKGFSSFKRAWFAVGKEYRGGAPYLDRKAFFEWAKEHGLGDDNKKYSRLLNYIASDRSEGNYIKPLIEAKLIEPHENGWIVIDFGTQGQMTLDKNSK
jgi:hypothetical protein